MATRTEQAPHPQTPAVTGARAKVGDLVRALEPVREYRWHGVGRRIGPAGSVGHVVGTAGADLLVDFDFRHRERVPRAQVEVLVQARRKGFVTRLLDLFLGE